MLTLAHPICPWGLGKHEASGFLRMALNVGNQTKDGRLTRRNKNVALNAGGKILRNFLVSQHSVEKVTTTTKSQRNDLEGKGVRTL
jgi:arylamine N-acetyltransferase